MAWWAAIPAVLKALGIGASAYSAFNQPKYQQAQPVDPAQALLMAKTQLNPQFQANLEGALKALQMNAIARGVMGQVPTANSAQKLAANNDLQRQAAIASLAQSIMTGQNSANAQAVAANNSALANQYAAQQQGINAINGIINSQFPGQIDWNSVFNKTPKPDGGRLLKPVGNVKSGHAVEY